MSLAELEATKIFKAFVTADEELPEDLQQVTAVCGHVKCIIPVLDRVSEAFPEFTLHDAGHSLRVVQRIGEFLPDQVLEALNAVELAILIYAAYLHDVGMVCDPEEKREIVTSPEFVAFAQSDEKRWRQIEKAHCQADAEGANPVKLLGGLVEGSHTVDLLLQAYLRPQHASRVQPFIQEHLAGEINLGEVAYDWAVVRVCESHTEPARVLRDASQFPSRQLFLTYPVNIQFLAVCLRLGDILDLDPDRTPAWIMDYIHPESDTALREWGKHRSIEGYHVTPESIEISATCRDPVYQKALLECVDAIEQERRDCVGLLLEARDDVRSKYFLSLDDEVSKAGIQEDGTYEYHDISYRLDQDTIIELFTGERLYPNRADALRELLQNAIDTCRYRRAVLGKAKQPYEPQIEVRLATRDGRDWLDVSDNGMGMDVEVVERFLSRIGRSYYRSGDASTHDLDFQPIATFGLGILSTSMVSDYLEIDTLPAAELNSSQNGGITVIVRPERELFTVREATRTVPGTSVSLRLMEKHPFDGELHKTVSRYLPHVEFPVDVLGSEGRRRIVRHAGFDAAAQMVLPDTEWPIEMVSRCFDLDGSTTGGLRGQILLAAMVDPESGYACSDHDDGEYLFSLKERHVEVWRDLPEGMWEIDEPYAYAGDASSVWSHHGIRVRGWGPTTKEWFGLLHSAPGWHRTWGLMVASDVDLSGDWHLNLDVARSRAVADAHSRRLHDRYCALLAECLVEFVLEFGPEEPSERLRTTLEFAPRRDEALAAHIEGALEEAEGRVPEA